MFYLFLFILVIQNFLQIVWILLYLILCKNLYGLFQNILKLLPLLEKELLLLYGASSFHKGIDIGAPEGTKLYAICDGKITFADFLGGGGYTITLSKEDMKITYCHVSGNFLVSVRRYCSKRATYCKCRS